MENNAASAVESNDTYEEFVNQFRRSLETLSQYATSEGFELVPYENPALEKFRKLELPLAEKISGALTEYVNTLASVKEQREVLSRNLNTVWLQMRKMNLRPPEDFYEKVKTTDIVEIYETGGVQLFRSFHFFQYCSYDLETLLCMHWYELFERDAQYEAAYMTVFGRLIMNQVKGLEKVQCEPHVVSERFARRRRSMAYPGYFCTLYDPKGRPCAWAHVLTIDALDS